MPTNEDKLSVLSGLAMFAREGDEDEDESDEDGASARPRLAGGSRPLTSAGVRALVQEAHEDTPTSHEVPPDPQEGDEDPPPRPRARPGQPSARQDVAQVARPMGGASDEDASGPPTASVCARLRARLRAHFVLNERASALMSEMLTELSNAGSPFADDFSERIDEWSEQLTDAVTM